MFCRDTILLTLKGVERPLVASSYWLRLLPTIWRVDGPAAILANGGGAPRRQAQRAAAWAHCRSC